MMIGIIISGREMIMNAAITLWIVSEAIFYAASSPAETQCGKLHGHHALSNTKL